MAGSAPSDIPREPSAATIAERRYALVRRGFDPTEVLDFMNEIVLRMEALEAAIAALSATGQHAPDHPN